MNLAMRLVRCPTCSSPNGVPQDPDAAAAAGAVPAQASPALKCKCWKCGKLFDIATAEEVAPGNRRARRAQASKRRRPAPSSRA